MSSNLPAEPENQQPVLSNSMYNKLKFVAQILLPAVGALYFGLASIWGLPAAGEVVGTVTVVDLFLGALLGLSSKQYNDLDAAYDGYLHVNDHDPSLIHQLEITTEPEQLGKQDTMLLKVVPAHAKPPRYPEDDLS